MPLNRKGLDLKQLTPSAMITTDTAQTIGTGAFADVTFDITDHESELGMVELTNNRLVAPVKGVYLITGNLRWVGNSTGIRKLVILGDGTTTSEEVETTGTTATFSQNISVLIKLNQGAAVKLRAFQDTGGNLDTSPTGDIPNLGMFLVTKLK